MLDGLPLFPSSLRSIFSNNFSSCGGTHPTYPRRSINLLPIIVRSPHLPTDPRPHCVSSPRQLPRRCPIGPPLAPPASPAPSVPLSFPRPPPSAVVSTLAVDRRRPRTPVKSPPPHPPLSSPTPSPVPSSPSPSPAHRHIPPRPRHPSRRAARPLAPRRQLSLTSGAPSALLRPPPGPPPLLSLPGPSPRPHPACRRLCPPLPPRLLPFPGPTSGLLCFSRPFSLSATPSFPRPWFLSLCPLSSSPPLASPPSGPLPPVPCRPRQPQPPCCQARS